MTRAELYQLLMRCNGAQLTALTAMFELNAAYLPGEGQAVAVRANEILRLTEQLQLQARLETALLEMFPPVDPAQVGARAGAQAAAKPRRLLILAANPLETDRLRIDEEVRLIKQRLAEAEPGR